MKKPKPRTKSPFGQFFLRFLLAGILSVAFFLLMFPFLERAEGLSFDAAATVGSANMWRIVFFYGFFTSIFVFFAFWRKIFRLTAVILILCWLAGTSVVLLVNSDHFNANEQGPAGPPSFTGQEVFDAVNAYRKENGVVELKLDENLCNNLAQRYFDIKKGIEEGIAHKNFEEWYDENVKPLGYFINEDYAWGNTPQEVIKAWKGSPGHRLSILNDQNILGCSYATEGHAIIVLGYKQKYSTQKAEPKNQVPSRTGNIISYREWCSGKEISIYENELITKPSTDGNIYTMTQGDWDCYENFLKNRK